MSPQILPATSVLKGILTLPVQVAALVANSLANWQARRILDRRVAAADLDCAGKMVVYTAIFGGKDELQDAPSFHNVDFLCFTDNPKLTSRAWKIVTVVSEGDPRKAARIYKIVPHRFLSEYQCSLWVDGTHIPAVDPRYLVYKYLENVDIAMFAHYSRDCIYDEMQACIRYGKGNADDIRRQEAAYRSEGYPAHNGLATCTVILRRHHLAHVKRTMEDWWAEIERHSIRDQLSFNYVAYRNKLSYATIPGYVYNNFLFHVEGHSHPDRSALSVGWLLNGSEETASSRFMGYNMHRFLLSRGIRSKILFRPQQRYAASINLELEQVNEVLRHNINLLVIVKLDSGRALNHLILRCRQLDIRLVYAVSDLPLSRKLVKHAAAILAPSAEFSKVLPGRYRQKMFPVFDGYEHDPSARKIHHRERKLTLCMVTNRVWDRVPFLETLPEGVSLKIIGPSAEMLKALYPGSRVFRNSPFDFEYLPWSQETVLRDILSCDAGIIPWPRIDKGVRVKSANRLVLFMSLGMPVIASPVPSYLGIVRNNVNGFIASTADEWQDAIEGLRDDPVLRQRIGAVAREEVVPRFSMEKQGEAYLEAFTQVLRS